ncbi:hypothetical protein RFI_08423 [Reticulomyxa filosa]|uniref:Uncharacterized protein n=1 Tax=Reticulomyxa filosa TaxID=46433 RepID=X6NSH1_RETFI|nr:hypothetical protein RFI_08423 [Reticulomyxa filosa]|eukprot:ETO28704.1 hypothetical protein RFI_08423 [Reticulomyxa filosa]
MMTACPSQNLYRTDTYHMQNASVSTEESQAYEKKMMVMYKLFEDLINEEARPGTDLQGYCTNETCLVSKATLPLWMNIGFGMILTSFDTMKMRMIMISMRMMMM